VEHVRAAVRSDTVVLVRVAESNIGSLSERWTSCGRVVIPWVETAEQLRQAVAYARFPRRVCAGSARSARPVGTVFGSAHREANEHVLVVPIIESVHGGRNIDALLQVDGIELFFFGRRTTPRRPPSRTVGRAGVAETILAIKDRIRAAGKHCGVLATSDENLRERRPRDFACSARARRRTAPAQLTRALAAVGRDRTIVPTFAPESAAPTQSFPAAGVSAA